MDSKLEELESLLLDWEVGTLDASGIDRVRELLRSSDEARRFYLLHQSIDTALKLDVAAGIEMPHGPGEGRARSAIAHRVAGSPRHPFRVRSWAGIAVTLLICTLAGRVLYLEMVDGADETATSNRNQRPAAEEATSSGVALLTRIVDVEWSPRQTPFTEGDAVPAGRLSFAEGFVQLEFFCGATVVVEGPAELDLESATRAHVHRGRLRAQVPPAARGFALEVDDLQVVDLGTEFGLAVSQAGAVLQVFDGEVEVKPAQDAKRVLVAGEAIKRSTDGAYRATETTPENFLDIVTLDAHVTGQREARYAKWKAWSRKLRRDARLLAYYAFDQTGGWNRKLHSCVEPNTDELDGAIVGARRVAGRWPSKSGLEFKRPADRVRVQIPGEFGSLTFACWVKIDSLDRWYNSLFLTDAYNQGEPHWQILDSGQLFFSVRHRSDNDVGEVDVNSPAHHKVLSPPFWKPSLSGRWLHLATTYDAPAGRVAHYLNGTILHEEDIDEKLMVATTRIGAASIGNWSIPTRPDEEFAVRNLNGTIDEFIIFADALSAEEIKEIHEHGQP